MGVFKEEAIMLDDLAKQQERIWKDGCDVGIKANDITKDIIRGIVKTLLPLPGSKVVWRQKADNWFQIEYNLRIYWSEQEYSEWKVLYYKSRKKEFFTIQ